MKSIILKISGELFKPSAGPGAINTELVNTVINQIKQLQKTHRIGIVIGGGNFFRGTKEGKQLNLTRTTGDAVGMLATVMNGLILRDLFDQAGIVSTLLNAHYIPGLVDPINPATLGNIQKNNALIIFAGGTGNPFFSTDTAAVLRALQINAAEVWKATNVDGVYDADPAMNKQAKQLKKLTYTDVIAQNLKIMDQTAIMLAQEHGVTIRVFNLFAPDALLQAAQKQDFGSTIHK